MIEEVFEDLVGQFSDPFTFYRELIQNAMDAGSNQVDITVEWRSDKKLAQVTVTDAGEGMTLDIIEHELTRLFSSSKENDFTKIGKFGIGFVSVFAIAPELVLVDTGREGEFWRVAFNGTTDYQVLKLAVPVEGTSIRVYKKIPRKDFKQFKQRSLETIAFWCRYSENQISFNGRSVNETLRVDSPCQVYFEKSGTQVVAGLSSSTVPAFGLYNRGLTLMEDRQDQRPGVTFKIKSHYLEHTLTRDNVLHDNNYRKAMAILDKVVREDLTGKLYKDAQDLLAEYPDSAAQLHHLMAAAGPLLSRWESVLPRKLHGAPLFPSLTGQPLSISELRRAGQAEGVVYIDSRASQVTRVLAQQDIPVVWAEAGSATAAAVAAVTGRDVRVASSSLAVPQPVDTPEAFKKISKSVVRLLPLSKAAVRKVRMADFHYEGSCVHQSPCLMARREGSPIRLFERGFWRSLQAIPGALLYNQHHPLVKKAVAMAESNPRLAAFVLAKTALLCDGLSGTAEAGLVARSVGIKG